MPESKMPDSNKPANQEEQIDLGRSGQNPGQQSPGQPSSEQHKEAGGGGHDVGGQEGVPDMGARSAMLEEICSPGMSDTDLVDAILQLPDEKLIPWEPCRLPSLGIYYGWDTDRCEVRAMGQASEKILATQRLAQSGDSINYLFRQCCRFPNGMDPLNLLVGDRVFLLYYLRGITHGNIYEFAVTCRQPDCGQVTTHVYDLNNLARTIRWADPANGSEPFKVTLPYLSRSTNRDFWVGVRFLRGHDTSNMIETRKTRKKLTAQPAIRTGRNIPRQKSEPTIDDTLTENLQMVIASVMGRADRMTIDRFAPRMHSTDTAAVRDWLRDNSPGIETVITITCPECGQEFMVELPITESFFRPTPQR